jgi:hypothetical protein
MVEYGYCSQREQQPIDVRTNPDRVYGGTLGANLQNFAKGVNDAGPCGSADFLLVHCFGSFA